MSYNPADFYINLLSGRKNTGDKDEVDVKKRIDRIVGSYTYQPKFVGADLDLSTEILDR